MLVLTCHRFLSIKDLGTDAYATIKFDVDLHPQSLEAYELRSKLIDEGWNIIETWTE